MTWRKHLGRTIARKLGFLDPVRLHAAEVVDLERQLAKVSVNITELTRRVQSMNARLTDGRAEVARLHYSAKKAARAGAEPHALRCLSSKRQAESRVRELEEDLRGGRSLLKRALHQRDELNHTLETLQRAFEANTVIRLAENINRNARAPSYQRRLDEARHELLEAVALAELDDPSDDPFEALPELQDPDDRLLVARWRAQHQSQGAAAA